MQVKVFIMDVDGTMTDGKIYMGAGGELMKAFDVKDGYGIHKLLPSFGVKTVIMTGRKSEIVDDRAKELEIDLVLQGIEDKKLALQDIIQLYDCQLQEIAYIGDDENDLPAMQVCGASGCPGDAVGTVRGTADYVCERSGGDGAVREFAEWLIKEGRIK